MNLLNVTFNNTPNGIFQGQDIFSDKKVLVFGLPGAFTPTCTNKQLPAYENMYDDFIEKGIDEIYCVSVNDGFVMGSWFDSLGIEKVQFLADGNGDFTRRMGMLVKKENLGFGNRSWRYAAVINNGNVEQLFAEAGIEDDHGEDPYEMSKPEFVIEHI